MVNQAVAEPEAPATLSDQEPSAPLGNADAQPLADAANAAPPEQEDDSAYDAEAQAYLERSRSKEGETSAPEPQTAQGRPVLSPEQQAYYQDAKRALAANYQRRQGEIDSYEDEMLSLGLEKPFVDRFIKEQKDRLNSHHADALRLGYADVYDAASSAFQDSINLLAEQALAQVLPKPLKAKFDSLRNDAASKNDGVATWQTVFQSVFDLARDGWVEGKVVDQRVLNAWKNGRREREQAGEVDGARSGTVPRQGVASGNGRYANQREADAAHVAGRITNQERRRIRNDPSIPS